MALVDRFTNSLSPLERKALRSLTTIQKIQSFLDAIPYSAEERYRCPLTVLRDRTAHCFDGALFGAFGLRQIGYAPLVVAMLPNSRDDDHLVAVFKRDGHWGAIGKSNFSGLRYREPVYASLRELIMSYFEHYYNSEGERTMRAYTRPLNLRKFDKARWMTKDDGLDLIGRELDRMTPIPVVSRAMISRLTRLDKRSYDAGMLGVNEAGLFKLAGKKGQNEHL